MVDRRTLHMIREWLMEMDNLVTIIQWSHPIIPRYLAEPHSLPLPPHWLLACAFTIV